MQFGYNGFCIKSTAQWTFLTNLKLNYTVRSFFLPRNSSLFCFVGMEREKNPSHTLILCNRKRKIKKENICFPSPNFSFRFFSLGRGTLFSILNSDEIFLKMLFTLLLEILLQHFSYNVVYTLCLCKRYIILQPFTFWVL